MNYPWLRLWNAMLTSPKVQLLSDRDHRAWITLLVVANQGKPRGSLPSIEHIAFHLRCDVEAAQAIMDRLIHADLMDVTDGVYRPHDWDHWQPKGDTPSTQRVREYRQKKKSSECNVSETFHETEVKRFTSSSSSELTHEEESKSGNVSETEMKRFSNVSHTTQSPEAAFVIAKAKERWEAIDLDAEIQANELIRSWGAELAGQALDKTFLKLGKRQKPWSYANTICRGGINPESAGTRKPTDAPRQYHVASKDTHEIYEREEGSKG